MSSVLIIDDDPFIRTAVRTVLGKSGITTAEAENGESPALTVPNNIANGERFWARQ
jgi:CheY-like chemotaxis protein